MRPQLDRLPPASHDKRSKYAGACRNKKQQGGGGLIYNRAPALLRHSVCVFRDGEHRSSCLCGERELPRNKKGSAVGKAEIRSPKVLEAGGTCGHRF
jgi:hypothetical protein